MKFIPARILSVLFISLFMFAGCDSTRTFQPPDTSTVPGPFDISGLEPQIITGDVQVYTVDEGEGVDEVTIRDIVDIFVTLRSENGEIIFSTYSNGSTFPSSIEVASITATFVLSFDIRLSYSEGLRNGIIGMKRNERRTLIVPPAAGFFPLAPGSLVDGFRRDTLRYDVLITDIRN
ncbi:MAG: FKBP-type peptidyl-prolyl cis-trans isomerase [Balneolaceae bacterium]